MNCLVSCDKTRGRLCCQVAEYRSLESQQCYLQCLLLAVDLISTDGQVDLSMGFVWQATSAKFDSLNSLCLSNAGPSILVWLFYGRCPRTYSENAPFVRLRHLSLRWLR